MKKGNDSVLAKKRTICQRTVFLHEVYMSETGQSAAEKHAPKRVLIVDDDVAFAQATSYAIQSQGYDVSVANDGSEALVMIDRVDPDLMILDMMMPKRSGFGVIKTIHRHRAKPLKIIMCAASEGNRQKSIPTTGVLEFAVSEQCRSF